MKRWAGLKVTKDFMLTFHLSSLPTTRPAWQPVELESSFWDSWFLPLGWGKQKKLKSVLRGCSALVWVGDNAARMLWVRVDPRNLLWEQPVLRKTPSSIPTESSVRLPSWLSQCLPGMLFLKPFKRTPLLAFFCFICLYVISLSVHTMARLSRSDSTQFEYAP